MDDGLHITVHKLGHEIEEIRVRALDNILTKINFQIVSHEQILDVPELFPNLVKWFQFPSVPKKSKALELIHSLIQNNQGLNLLLRNDPDLSTIRSGIGSGEKEIFEKICCISDVRCRIKKKNGKRISAESRQESIQSAESILSSETSSNGYSSSISPRVELSFHSSLASDKVSFPTWNNICWPSPTLAPSDQKVLSTVRTSLQNESQIEQATYFFSTVILSDFPPQIFINDTSIVQILLQMIEKNNEMALECIEQLTLSVLKYFKYYSDSAIISSNCFMIDDRAGGDTKESTENHDYDSQVLGISDFCALILDKIGVLDIYIFPVISLCISDPEIFWNANDPKLAPLKHSIVSVLSNIGHNLVRNKGLTALKRLTDQIIAAKILKASVPLTACYTVVPKEMQEAISLSLIDPILYLLHPNVHSFLLTYVQNFKYQDKKLYKEFSSFAHSIKCGARFLKSTEKFSEMLVSFQDSLLALEIHKEYKIIELFFNIIFNSYDLSQSEVESTQEITARLLSLKDAKLISYKTICDFLTEKLGPRAIPLNDYSSLLFIINKKALKQIIFYGLCDENSEVRNCSETLLILILKSRLIVSKSSWRWLISEISCLFTVLEAYADLNTSLGRTIVGMLDPDTSKEIMMPLMEVLTGNIRLMMSKNTEIRSEGTARIIYLLNIPSSIALNEFTLGENPVSSHSIVGGYEEGSLIRVLEVLGQKSDPQITKSALTQLSLIMEDRSLHITFLNHTGLEIITSYLHSSVNNVSQESKAIFSNTIVVLKHLSRHNAQLRHDFSTNYDLYDSILKGVFIHDPDWRLLRDVSQLLSLMVYADVVLTTSETVSFPHPVVSKIKLPFDSKTHLEVSEYYESKIEVLDDKAIKSLELLWFVFNTGIEKIASSQTVSQVAIEDLISCYIPNNVNKYLLSLNTSNSHSAARNALIQLKQYMKYVDLSGSSENLAQLPWDKTFLRYLTTLPASVEDQLLLVEILQFLVFSSKIVPEMRKWLSNVVRDPSYSLNSLLTRVSISDNTAIGKKVLIEILSLVEICLDDSDGWDYMTNMLIQCLSNSHMQKFYSIAVMNKLLNCLLKMTELKKYFNPKCFWELLNAFHCDTQYSCMGLTITRRAILILSNLLVLKPKDKKYKIPEEAKWLQNIIGSKDIVVKASTLELISGLIIESSLQITKMIPKIWETCLNIILDHNEPSLIREQAANVYSNLIASTETKSYVQMCISSNLFACISLIAARINFSSHLKHTVIKDLLFTSLSCSLDDNILTGVTTPSLFISCCRLILNLISKEKEIIISALHSQGLTGELFRQVCQWQSCKTLRSQEIINMYTYILDILTHCTHLTCVKECVPTLIWLLQKSTYEEVDYINISVSSLKLLGSIASNHSIDVLFTKESVKTLCEIVSSASAASAASHLIPFLTSEANIEIVQKLRNCPESHRFLLASILGVSHSGTKAALENNLLDPLILRLKETHINLAVMPPDIPRSKKANSVLNNLSIDLCLLINFIAGSSEAKEYCVKLGLADIIHKLWAWCLLDVAILSTLLQVLITFTAKCPSAASTLVLTSTMVGVGQRKTPTSSSILHAVIGLFSRDVYGSDVKKMVLELLQHACQALEARMVMNKSNLLNEFLKMGHTRRSSQLDEMEMCWLRFFVIFSSFLEGQTCLIKNDDAIERFFEILMLGKPEMKAISLSIIRNLVLTPANKQRFISSDNFLKTISERTLDASITTTELEDIFLIVWHLAANSQRGKYAVRNVNIESRLHLALIPHQDDVKIVQLAKIVFPIIKPP